MQFIAQHSSSIDLKKKRNKCIFKPGYSRYLPLPCNQNKSKKNEKFLEKYADGEGKINSKQRIAKSD